MTRILRLLAATLVLAGTAYLFFWSQSASDTPSQAPARWTSSRECRPCHETIYEEWETGWHRLAFLDPDARELSNDFENKDCIPCHAPRPVFETGIGPYVRVLARHERREEGVDCIACHLQPDGTLAGPSEGIDAPCRPRHNPALGTVDFCAPCHNQHQTVDEWKESPAAAAGKGCNDCHLLRAEGNGRGRRVHRWPGGRDPKLVASAFAVDAEVRASKLAIAVTNTFAGHNLPTDSRHCALDLVVDVRDAAGTLLPPAEERPSHLAPGTFRARFRNPYRDDPYETENTQIHAGETSRFEFDLPVASGRAAIRMIYKKTPYLKDEEGMEVFLREIEF